MMSARWEANALGQGDTHPDEVSKLEVIHGIPLCIFLGPLDLPKGQLANPKLGVETHIIVIQPNGKRGRGEESGTMSVRRSPVILNVKIMDPGQSHGPFHHGASIISSYELLQGG